MFKYFNDVPFNVPFNVGFWRTSIELFNFPIWTMFSLSIDRRALHVWRNPIVWTIRLVWLGLNAFKPKGLFHLLVVCPDHGLSCFVLLLRKGLHSVWPSVLVHLPQGDSFAFLFLFGAFATFLLLPARAAWHCLKGVSPLYNALTGPDWPVRGFLVYETRDPVLLVSGRVGACPRAKTR